MSNRTDISGLLVQTREEADEVLHSMRSQIARLKYAAVADLLTIVGIPCVYADEKWGWTAETFEGAKAVEIEGGFRLELPEAQKLFP